MAKPLSCALALPTVLLTAPTNGKTKLGCNKRQHWDWLHAPFNCYEVHLGSWQRSEHGQFIDYGTMAEKLIPHVRDMGYTHIELLPVTEHPLNESWGYQTTGYFAATNRFGDPDDFTLLYRCLSPSQYRCDFRLGARPLPQRMIGHWRGLMAPHYTNMPTHAWVSTKIGGTYIFNYGRNEVRNFLLKPMPIFGYKNFT